MNIHGNAKICLELSIVMIPIPVLFKTKTVYHSYNIKYR